MPDFWSAVFHAAAIFRTGFPDQLMTYGQSASWCCQRARVGIRSLRMGMSRFFSLLPLFALGILMTPCVRSTSSHFREKSSLGPMRAPV